MNYDTLILNYKSKISVILLFSILFFSNTLFAETKISPSPPPPPVNDNCVNAISVTVNGLIVSGVTQNATLEAGELTDCAIAGSTQSVWYYFTATATSISVSVNSTAGGCFLSSAIWSGASGCPVANGCSALSCQSAAGGPNNNVHNLINLTIGIDYYIQIMYNPGGACGASAGFDVTVSTTLPANPSNPPPVSTCSSPAGSVCVLNFLPGTYAQIAANCTTYPNPVAANNNNEVYHSCFSFTAQYSSTINFQMAPTSTCGTFTWWDWQLYNSSCSSIDCGDYNNLSSTGLICGNNYEMCYTFEIPNGCTYTSIIPYIIAIPPVIAVPTTQAICKGESVPLTAFAIGDVSYQWAPSTGLNATTGATVTANPLVNTTYTVTGFDAGGCTQTATVVVVVHPVPVLSASLTPPSCGNSNGIINLTVSGGGGPFTYLWSNGYNNQDLTFVLAGTYIVTVTNTFGCTATYSGTLNNTGFFTSSFTQINNTCAGGTTGSINITPQIPSVNPPYTYLWTTGATSQDLNSLSTGTYTITISNSVGCTSIQTINITEPPLMNISSVIANVNCFGSATGGIDLTVTGGTAPYIYHWNTNATTQDLSNLFSGNYSVTVYDANGCSAVAGPITITQPAPISFSDIITNASCSGSTDGAVDITVNGGSNPYTFAWSNGATTEDVTALSAGPISVNIFDASGCPYTWNGNIAAGTGLILSANITHVFCFGNGNGAVNLTVTAGSLPFTYNWSNGGTTQDLSNLSGGVYSVTVIDAAGCSVTGSYTVLEPSAMSLFETHLVVGCDNNSINLTVASGSAPFTYIWSNGATIQDPIGIPAGNYSVTVTDANNCTAVLSNIVINSSPVNTVNLLQAAPSCGVNDGTALIDFITGGGGPFTYLWSNGGTTTQINNISAGTYSVTVSNSSGCTSSASITLISPSGPALSSTHVDVLCNGASTGSINLSVVGGTAPFNYIWSNGSTIQDPLNLTAGNYTVTVTDVNNCQVTTTINISQNASTVLSQTNVNSTCGSTNGSINLSVVGTSPFIYLWNNAATIQDLSFIGAGNYSVTVTDANSCTSSLSVTVNNSPGPTLSFISQDVSCNGAASGSINLTVNGGTAPFTYLWNNGATTQDISNLITGIYTVVVTDANNCIANGGVIIIQPAVNILSETHVNATCGLSNGSIDLTVTGSNPPFVYLWSNASSFQDLSGLAVGTYTVTVTDFNLCSSTLSVSISNTSGPTLTETHIDALCNGANSGSINLSVNGGLAPYTYFWNTTATTQDINNLVAGNFTVTVTDFNNCQSISTIIISQPTALSLSETHVNANCGSSNGSINLSVTGGTINYSYNWSNGAITQDISSISSGAYTVTVTDVNNCSATLTINLSNLSGPSLTETHSNVLCNGNNSGNINLTVNGGTAPYTYIWSNSATAQDINNLLAGNYTVTVTDFNNCQATITINISEPALLTLSETHIDATCSAANGSINLSVNGGSPNYAYNWNNASTTQDVSVLNSGVYTVTVTEANNCSVTLSINIGNTNGPVLSETHVNVLCNGSNSGSIDLSINAGTAPYSYIWSNASATQDISALITGNYTVTVTDFNNCQSSLTINISEPTTFAISETHIDANCGTANGSINLTVAGATPNYSYIWSNGFITQDINNISAGAYTVTVTDANSCSTTSIINISNSSGPVLSETHVNVLCFGNGTGSIDLSVIGGVTPYTYLWSNAATTQDIVSLISGAYTVTVTDFSNCQAILSINITEPIAISLTETHVDVFCNGNNSGSINLTVNGGVAPYSYLWSNAFAIQDISALSAGTYTVTVTDFNNCTSTTSLNIIEPTVLAVSETHIDAGCGSSNGSIDITVSGGSPNYNYNWNNAAISQDISNISSGGYTVTVTDANNCSASLSVNIANTSGPGLNETHVNALCNSGNTGSIDLSVNGGTVPYNYTWNNGSTSQDLSNLISGNYSVTVSDFNNCSGTVTVIILQPTAIVLSETHANPSCGIANGSINLNVNGGTPNYSYLWSNGAIVQDISNVGSATYTVTVTDANGCTSTLSINLFNGNGPSLSETHVNANCGIASGSIDLTVTGGVVPYFYVWSNAFTTQDISNLIGGLYSVTVTDINFCSTVISINLPTTSSVSLQTAVTNVTCFGFNDGAVNLTVSGGTPSYTYHWNNNATSQDLNGISGNVYGVTVTDLLGCTAVTSATVIEHGQLTPSQTHINATCGLSNGSIDLSAFGGFQPYSYLWSNGAITQDLSGLSAGNYSVTVSDVNLCTATLSTTIAISSGPTTQFVSTNVLCNGASIGAINLTVNGGSAPYSYLWSNNSNVQDLNNIPAGNYSVTVTDANNCSVTGAVLITQPSAIQVNETHVDASCGNSNGTIDITVSGGTLPYSYIWSNSSNTEDLNNLAIGNYSITVTDGNNCSATITISIINGGGSLPLSNIATDETCSSGNGSIDLSVNAGTAPYNYAWSNAQITQDIANLSAGNYSVTVTDAGGCTGTATAAINNHPSPSLSTTHLDETCSNSNGSIDLTVTVGALPYSYIWSNNSQTEDISNLSTGNYSVTVTDGNNCTANIQVSILNSSGPIINEIHFDENCNQANGSINLTINGGILPYSFNWNNGTTTEDISNLGSGNYSVTVTDVNGCSNLQSILINNIAGPQLSETHISTSCGLNNGSVDLTVTGGTFPFIYSWSNNYITQDLQNISPNTYSVTVTDAGGCTAELTGINIISSTIPNLNETHTSSTCGNANAGVDLTVTGGTAGYNYIWSNNSVTEDIANIVSGNYSVTVTDAAGCTVSLNALINNIAGPQLTIIPTATSCGNYDGSIDLIVNGGANPYSYLWSNSTTTEDVTSLAGGNYSVTVTDANNCTVEINIDVIASIYPLINAHITGNKGCIPLSIFFNNTSSNATTYSWIFGDGTTSNDVSPTHQYNQIGNFPVELIATSSTGCSDTLAIDTVSIYETPIADFTSVPWINETTLLSLAQFNFTNQSLFASTYLWNFGDGNNSNEINPVYTYTTEGEFYVTLFAFNINGCADTVTYGPFTLIADGDIFIPNTFTPNGDHYNDVFKIYGTGITAEHLWIYDRWGEKLFESAELFSEWDGKYLGVDLNIGVYVYQLEVTRYDGTIEFKKGDVTLLR